MSTARFSTFRSPTDGVMESYEQFLQFRLDAKALADAAIAWRDG